MTGYHTLLRRLAAALNADVRLTGGQWQPTSCPTSPSSRTAA